MRFLIPAILLFTPVVFCGETAADPKNGFPDWGLAAYLQAYGGWAVSAICMIALVHLYNKTSNLLEKRNEQFIAVLEKTTAALTAVKDAMEDCRRRSGGGGGGRP